MALGACTTSSGVIDQGGTKDSGNYAFSDTGKDDTAEPGDSEPVGPGADLGEPDQGHSVPDVPPADPGGEDAIKPSEAALVVNEIMYNPKAVDDELGEWVELYNLGAEAVDLKGWTLRGKASNIHVIAATAICPAGGYCVLGRNGDVNVNGGYTATYMYGEEFFLGNKGDTVQLLDPSGTLVDEVTYQADVPWPALANGYSIELVSPEVDNAQPGSWALAVQTYGKGDRGTPGGPNGGAVKSFTVDEDVPDFQSAELKASLRYSPEDDLEGHVLAELAKTKQKVRLAFFNIRHDGVLDVLKALLADGVDIGVIMDKKQQDLDYNDMDEKMAAAGIPVTLVEKTKGQDATMHDKFTVIDSYLVLAGSANYSFTALNKSDEDMVTIEDADLAARYETEFDEIAADGSAPSDPYPPTAKATAWMGPEDDLDGKVKLLLDAATSEIDLGMFQLNLDGLVDALVAANGRGVQVVVILDAVQAEAETADETLAAAGIPVILAKNETGLQTEMHSKFAVVDHETVIMGSYNWTNLATFYNDENLLILHDKALAARAEGKIAELLVTYATQDPATLGLDVGPKKVTLTVTNLTLDPGATLQVKSVGAGPFEPPVAFEGPTLTVTLESGTRVEYRYVVQGPGGAFVETGDVHWFRVPFSPGPFALKDVFHP